MLDLSLSVVQLMLDLNLSVVPLMLNLGVSLSSEIKHELNL